MSTYTDSLINLLNANGTIKNSKLGIKLADLTTSDYDSGSETNNYFFGYDGEFWRPISGTEPSIDFSLYSTKTDIDTQLDTLVNGAGTSFDTLGEIATLMNNDVNFATKVREFIDRQKYRVHKGDGTTTHFECSHQTGNVDVWLNGLRLIPKVRTWNDTDGSENFSSASDYDYVSLKNGSISHRVNFIVGHDVVDYGLHWRTNFTDTTSKTKVDKYVIYEFNENNIPTVAQNFLDTVGVGGYVNLVFPENIAESSHYQNLGQRANKSYGVKYLGFYDADRKDDTQDIPSFSSPNFSGGPIGQIGSPYYVDIKDLIESTNSQENSIMIRFNTAPSNGDNIVIRSY